MARWRSLLDFGARPQGEERPQESLAALFSMKRQLAGAGFKTPRFDFAALTYLHRTGADYRARLPQLFPSSELEGAIDMADALAALPVIGVGKALVSYLGRRTGDSMFRKVFAKRVDAELVERVLELPAEPELIGVLPELFAQDLNAHRRDGPVDGRIVLFFDTHEAFWGADRFPPGRIVPLHIEARDQWLRRLLRNLNLEQGIVCLVAGREPPVWDRAANDPIPGEFVDLCSLDGLERLFPAEMRAAHQALLTHHEARAVAGHFDDDVEAIYHQSWLNPDSGVERWIALARDCLDAGRFERLKRLARIWSEMPVATATGRQEALVLLARAMIGWGQPELAAELATQLAPGSISRAIVDAELAFAKQEFAIGRELVERALPEAAPEQAAALRFRLAELELFAGNFARGAALADAALDGTDQRNPRWLVLRGEIALFDGDLGSVDN